MEGEYRQTLACSFPTLTRPYHFWRIDKMLILSDGKRGNGSDVACNRFSGRKSRDLAQKRRADEVRESSSALRRGERRVAGGQPKIVKAGTHLLGRRPIRSGSMHPPALARAAVPLFYRRVGNALGMPSAIGMSGVFSAGRITDWRAWVFVRTREPLRVSDRFGLEKGGV
jgi:hypothetical protein